MRICMICHEQEVISRIRAFGKNFGFCLDCRYKVIAAFEYDVSNEYCTHEHKRFIYGKRKFCFDCKYGVVQDVFMKQINKFKIKSNWLCLVNK